MNIIFSLRVKLFLQLFVLLSCVAIRATAAMKGTDIPGSPQSFFFPEGTTKMSFKNCEFDLAVISSGLHELHESVIVSISEEMGRVLKGSGRFYMIDYESGKGAIHGRP